MELAIPRVANDPPFVDQDEARPILDPVRVPHVAVVVLRVRIGDALPSERPGEIPLVVLTGVGWELRRMDADDRQAAVPIHPVIRDERRHRARAVAAREHPEVQQHHSVPQLGEAERVIAVEPARVGQLGRGSPATARDRRPDRRGARDDQDDGRADEYRCMGLHCAFPLSSSVEGRESRAPPTLVNACQRAASPLVPVGRPVTGPRGTRWPSGWMRNAWIAWTPPVCSTYRYPLFPLSAMSFTPPLMTAEAPRASTRLIEPSGAIVKADTDPAPLPVKPKRPSFVTTAQHGAP